MKTVKAKIKGTNAILEGCVCDDSFFVSVDHDTFERYDLDEVELCESNPNSLTLEEAAREIVIKMHPCLKDCTILGDRLTRGQLMALVKAGAEWQKEQDQPITGNSLEQEWLRYVDRRKKECGGELPCLGEYGWLQIARHFAEWQKSQMLKDAVEYKIVNNLAAYPVIYYEVNHLGLKDGDKVRIVVLKAEEE